MQLSTEPNECGLCSCELCMPARTLCRRQQSQLVQAWCKQHGGQALDSHLHNPLLPHLYFSSLGCTQLTHDCHY